MIIPSESVTSFVNKNGFYEGVLAKRRWGYNILKHEITLYGNIVLFEAPVQIGIMTLKKAIVIALEIPNCNPFGSACFTRLYCAQLGSLISESVQKNCFVDGNSLLLEEDQISLSINNNFDGTALINIIICTQTTKKHNILTAIQLDDDFKTKAIESFHHLTKNIFIETQRDNF